MRETVYQTLEDFLAASLRDEITPRFYFDTNVILDLIEGRQQSSLDLFEFLIGREEWELYTSVFAEVEVYEKKQKDEFRREKEKINWSNAKIGRNMDKRDLSTNNLKSISEQVDAELNDVVQHFQSISRLNDYGWDLAVDIKKTTNLTDKDTIHLAESLLVPCDVFLTRDKFLIDIAREFLWAVKPDEVIDILNGLKPS